MYFSTPAWDQALFDLCNQSLRGWALDVLMPVASSTPLLWLLGAAGALWLVARTGWKKTAVVLVVLAAMALADLGAGAVKSLTGRVRPLNAQAGVHYVEHGEWRTRPPDFVQTKEKGSSFPSAHAANAMAFAFAVILLWPKVRAWPLVLPLVVGYSRVYLGKHYPTDVLMGWLLGMAAALAAYSLWKLMFPDQRGAPPQRGTRSQTE